MSSLPWLLIPLALIMGLAGLVAFLWSMRSGQLEDLDGASERVLLPDAQDRPLDDRPRQKQESRKDSHD